MIHLVYRICSPVLGEWQTFEGDYDEFKELQGIVSTSDEFPSTSVEPLPPGVSYDERVGLETVHLETGIKVIGPPSERWVRRFIGRRTFPGKVEIEKPSRYWIEFFVRESKS